MPSFFARLRPNHTLIASFGILAGLVLLQVSCSPNDPQNTLATVGEVGKRQQDLFWLIFWLAAAVFFLVEGLLLFTILRYRSKPGQGIPVQTHGNTRLEIGWTIAPTLLLCAVAVPTVATTFDNARVPDVGMNVRVVGHQWWWEFEYPGVGVVTASDLHIPVGEEISLHIESTDVIHSFWVPKLAGKIDAIPSRVNTMWLKGDEPGTYLGQCVELCGIQHANMRFRVIVQPRAEFDAWVAQQKSVPGPPSDRVAEGAAVFANPTNQCIVCHTIEGTSGVGKVGPDLTHFGSRQTLAGGMIEHTPENLFEWLDDPDKVKPGNLMSEQFKNSNIDLSYEQITALVAYLRSLR